MTPVDKAQRLVALRESWARVRPRVTRAARAGLDEHIRREVRRADHFYTALLGREDPEPLVSVAGEELREFDAGGPERVDVLVSSEPGSAP